MGGITMSQIKDSKNNIIETGINEFELLGREIEITGKSHQMT